MTNSKRSPYSSDDTVASEKSVSILSFAGLKLEKSCCFWSMTIKNFCYCFFTNSADWAKILPRAKTTTKNFYQKLLGNYVHLRFTRALLIYRISIAWFLIYIGLRHKAVRTTTYLSGDFSRQWWSSCAKKYPACFLNSKIFAKFKLDFICSNLCFAANLILTPSGFFLIFLSKGFMCIKLYRFDFFFRTFFVIFLPKKARGYQQ